MRPPSIPLSVPHMALDVADCLKEALAQNWIANVGPSVDAFEAELAAKVGAAGCFASHCGTAALHLALELCNVLPGDLVFCSALTFVASANPIRYQQARAAFIDSEPGSGCMSPAALERGLFGARAAGGLPKAIIVVHLYGQTANMDAILALADQFGVPVIEDAAQALGSFWRDQAAGTMGRLGIYSFAGNKILTTSAGGALVARDAQLIERAHFLGMQARDEADHYEHSQLGYNYRLSNILASIGRSQLRVLSQRVAERRAVFARYRVACQDLPEVSWLEEPAHACSNRWLSVLLLDPAARLGAAELVQALSEQRIEARRVFKPLQLQPLYADALYYGHGVESVSERLFVRGVCLPSSSNLTLDDQQRVIDVVKRALRPVSSARGASRAPR